MKKRVFKKKKKIKECRARKLVKRALLTAAAVCLLSGMTLTAQGEEREETDTSKAGSQALKVVITEIYHKHMGNEGEMGGCYQVPIPHQHQGDEQTGGPCYQRIVYHTHAGNESEGGGCYTQPVYHQHEGDDKQGGTCYEEITHTHTKDCYQQEDCIVYHTLKGDVLSTWEDFCYSHQETLFGEAKGTASHTACGTGEEEKTYHYCLSCGFIAPTIHSYEKLACQIGEGTILGYQLSCGKDENTIDGYETGCGFTEGEKEAYGLSCGKTTEGYGTDCGFSQHQLCGRLIVTNETAQQARQAVISARIEDLTGGKLKSDSASYEWKDAAGKLLGTGERITVTENGIYSVAVKLENKDVEEAGLNSSILVDNIYKAQEEATPTPVVQATPEPTPEKTQESGENPQPSPSSPEENDTAAVTESEYVSEKEEDTEDNDKVSLPIEGTGKTFKQAKAPSAPSPFASPIKKKSESVRLPENKAREEAVYQIGQERERTGILDGETVKIITVAGSTLLLTAGLILLLFYLRHSVKVFNDDGEGRMLCLGRCTVKMEEEGYVITITEAMTEKSCTNRYCIKPGLFLLGKKDGQELVVYQGEKGVTVSLRREMIVVL